MAVIPVLALRGASTSVFGRPPNDLNQRRQEIELSPGPGIGLFLQKAAVSKDGRVGKAPCAGEVGVVSVAHQYRYRHLYCMRQSRHNRGWVHGAHSSHILARRVDAATWQQLSLLGRCYARCHQPTAGSASLAACARMHVSAMPYLNPLSRSKEWGNCYSANTVSWWCFSTGNATQALTLSAG